MKKTKANKVIEMLLAKGCKEVKGRSKYRTFERPDGTDFYFVGRNGALRAGKSASKSVSLTRFLKV